jgi:hypothetical protein
MVQPCKQVYTVSIIKSRLKSLGLTKLMDTKPLKYADKKP